MAPQTLAARPYAGEDLGHAPHVAVLFVDHIGGFVVATPLMRGLRERFPHLVLDYFGGERTRELEEASPLIDARFSLFGESRDALRSFVDGRRATAGPYALAVNLEADPAAARALSLLEPEFFVSAQPSSDGGEQPHPPASGIDRLRADVWNRPDLLNDYPELDSQFIGEIFCRLARVETDYAKLEVPVQPPPVSTPEVLVSTGASRSARLWHPQFWVWLARWLRERGETVGLLGAPPARQAEQYHAAETDAALLREGVIDLRGELSLPETAGALAQAGAFVTIDNGLMHLAAAVGAPTVALFGASPRRLWAPPTPAVRILEPEAPCPRCEENRFRNPDCLIPVHQCMLSISPARVAREVEALLGRPSRQRGLVPKPAG